MNLIDKNPIVIAISNWFRNTFAHPAAVSLFLAIVLGLLFIQFLGKLFLPVLISIVIAYLLASLVRLLERWHFPHLLAVLIAYSFFIGLFVIALVGLLPLLGRELNNLITELPNAFNRSQSWFNELVQRYPKIFSDIQLENAMTFLRDQSIKVGQIILKYSLSSIPGLIQVVLYLVLVPLLVFFFLKDSKEITHWFSRFLPDERSLVVRVWDEVNTKIGAYVRGRVIEVIIVGVVTAAVFEILGLQYSVLLGVLVGISVVIPYIGAVVVTIPVVIVALMQWGFSPSFTYLIIAYTLIIILDSNVLVPLLFAEAMDLHPVAIILSIVIFGAFWGFWGIFFAIPLATLVNAILKAWPKTVVRH